MVFISLEVPPLLYIARVQRRGKNIHLQILLSYVENVWRQWILVSYQWKIGMGVAT
jgi:hypothetical protein